jgi:micrococcal nuclease
MREFRSEITLHAPLALNGVIDGDTVAGHLDLGLDMWLHNQRFRLYGIDTPELRGKSRQAGLESRNRLISLIEEHSRSGYVLSIRTHKRKNGSFQDSFGRYLIDIFTRDHADTLNAILVREGLAKEYFP